jgi:hypothetical protein
MNQTNIQLTTALCLLLTCSMHHHAKAYIFSTEYISDKMSGQVNPPQDFYQSNSPIEKLLGVHYKASKYTTKQYVITLISGTICLVGLRKTVDMLFPPLRLPAHNLYETVLAKRTKRNNLLHRIKNKSIITCTIASAYITLEAIYKIWKIRLHLQSIR